MTESFESSQKNNEAKFITVEEARRHLEEEVANFVPSDVPGTDGGRTFQQLQQEALSDPDALQVYVDTWNSIVQKQMELDAGF